MSWLTKTLVLWICAVSTLPPVALAQSASAEAAPGPTRAEFEARIASLEAELKAYRRTVMTAQLAEKVEQLTEGLATDEQRALAICEWIASNISNRTRVEGDYLDWFAARAGYCGERAALAVEMLRIAFIPARIFNIYNFGGVGGGHSAIEVYLDGRWCYVDVMYAGYFRGQSGPLGWDEITSAPDQALRGMVVFPRTIDRWGPTGPGALERAPIDNQNRMTSVYTPTSLRAAARSAGPRGMERTKILSASIDLSAVELPLQLGEEDLSATDVTIAGFAGGYTEQLGASANSQYDSFRVEWRLSGLVKGARYAIDYSFFRWTHHGLRIAADAEGASLDSGHEFVAPDDRLYGEPNDWRIEFTAEDTEATIGVAPLLDAPDMGFYIDAVRLERVSE